MEVWVDYSGVGLTCGVGSTTGVGLTNAHGVGSTIVGWDQLLRLLE